MPMTQIIVKGVESKVMVLLVACENTRDMWIKLHIFYKKQD